MNTIGLQVCEICGNQSSEKAGWFAIAGSGREMEILPWNDQLHARPDCRLACGGDHLQKLLFSSAIEQSASSFTWMAPQHRGGWSEAALVPLKRDTEATVEESLINIIGEIDSILGATSDEEEAPAFDA